MKKLKLNIQGEEMEALCVKVGDTVWAHMGGRTIVYESEKTRSQNKQQQVGDPRKIKTPMPGKIIKVNCSTGDKVEKDQTLVVMEAMKMEYSLKSAMGGQVSKVLCKAGDSVGLGDLLVELTGESNG